MRKTAVVFSPKYLAHDTGSNHPESPRRLQAIMEGIRQKALLETENCSLIKPRSARLRDLELVHRPEYVNLVKKMSESGGSLDCNTVVSRESFNVARLASGGAIEAVDRVMAGEFQNAFALVRPPGHHATPVSALGFCIFNNIALAAAYLLRNFNLGRVLILDIDAHHGNGTQEMFYDTDKVLYMSLHEDPTEFPGTGFVEEAGEGQGLGYTVNIPFPFRTSDPAYWKAVKTIVTPIVLQYEPQFVLVSSGFDGYYRDSVGELSLSAYIYPRVFQTILDLAHRVCSDRVVAVLEGGYRPNFLGKIVPAIVAQMAGFEARIHDKRPYLDLAAERKAGKIIERARSVQSSFWAL